MKPIIATLAAALVLAPTFSHASALLFSENWSGIAAEANPVTGGQWKQPVGASNQFAVVENPLPGITGKWLTARYAAGQDVLPKLQTNETFQLSIDGIRLSMDVVLTDNVNDNNYLRVGIQNSSVVSYTNNYWFEVLGNYVRVSKIISGTLTNLKSYTFNTSEWAANTSANIAFSVTPLSSGNTELTLSLNGNEVIRVTDSTGAKPSFDEGFDVFIAARSPRTVYVSNVELQSIPEGSSMALLLGGAGLVWAAKRYTAVSVR